MLSQHLLSQINVQGINSTSLLYSAIRHQPKNSTATKISFLWYLRLLQFQMSAQIVRHLISLTTSLSTIETNRPILAGGTAEFYFLCELFADLEINKRLQLGCNQTKHQFKIFSRIRI